MAKSSWRHVGAAVQVLSLYSEKYVNLLFIMVRSCTSITSNDQTSPPIIMEPALARDELLSVIRDEFHSDHDTEPPHPGLSSTHDKRSDLPQEWGSTRLANQGPCYKQPKIVLYCYCVCLLLGCTLGMVCLKVMSTGRLVCSDDYCNPPPTLGLIITN